MRPPGRAYGKIESMMTRRTALLGGLGAMVGCTRRKAKGFSGYAFIANEEGGAVAAVDLEVFAVARHILVDGAPTAVVAQPQNARVYVLTPANGSVHEIRADNLTFYRKLRVADSAAGMRLSPDGRTLFILCREPQRLVALGLNPMRVDWTLPLPAEPLDLDISPDGTVLAISYGATRSITFVDPLQRKRFPDVPTSGEIGVIRFQSDSKQLIAANTSERVLSVYHVPSRA